MKAPKIVIDTNVIVSGLKSRLGASNKLMGLIGLDYFEPNLSVPLIIEYEKCLLDPNSKIPFSKREIEKILDFLCLNSTHIMIHYLWRPFLSDPKDDMVLELAIASGSKYIITFNKQDFKGSEQFDVKILSPKEFLIAIGVIKL